MKAERSPSEPRIHGFTLLELLITIVIIGVTTGTIAIFQRTTWSSTRRTNFTLIAGQLIQRQVEQMRMAIELDRDSFWPPANGSISDTALGIKVGWTVSDAHDPDGNGIDNVRGVEYVASWMGSRPDTLRVTTSLGHDF
jgi:prepilin-type N-terminal cleavage/methylation domain-containing protein